MSTTTPADHPGDAEPHDRVVVAGLAPAAGLPPVVHLALVARSPRGEDGGLGPDEVLPLGEQLVVGVHDAAAERPRGQVGQRREVGHRVLIPARPLRRVMPLPCSAAARAARVEVDRRPASQSARTTPRRVRPAYGVTGCRWCSRAGSTTNVSSGANSAQVGVGADARSGPCGSARPGGGGCGHPARPRRAARAPRSRASVQIAGRPSCSEAIPPQASAKSPLSSAFSSGGARRVVGHDACRSSPSASPAHSSVAVVGRRGSAGST